MTSPMTLDRFSHLEDRIGELEQRVAELEALVESFSPAGYDSIYDESLPYQNAAPLFYSRQSGRTYTIGN